MPIVITSDFVYASLSMWSGTNILWGVITSPMQIVLFPLLCIFDLLRSFFGEIGLQNIINYWFFVGAGISWNYFFWLITKSKIRILVVLFVLGNFLFWLGLARNVIFITGLFVFTPALIRLFIEYKNTWSIKKLFYIFLFSWINVVVSLNPWSLFIQWIILFIVGIWWFRYIVRAFISLFVLYFIAIPVIVVQGLFLLNNNAIVNDEWNNAILLQRPLEQQKKSSSLDNMLRGYNGDMRDTWGYVDKTQSEELYYSFPLAKQLDNTWFDIISWVPILFILLWLIFLKNKKIIALATGFLVTIFFMKSSAEPFGWLFIWMMENVPLFSIFRNPHQKFSIIYLLLISIIIIYFIISLKRKWKIIGSVLLSLYIITFSSFYFTSGFAPRVNTIDTIPLEYKESADFIESENLKRWIILPYNNSTWINKNFGFEWYHLFHYLIQDTEIFNKNDTAFSSYTNHFSQLISSHWNETLLLDIIKKYNIDLVILDKNIDRYNRFAHKEEHEKTKKFLDDLLVWYDKKVFWNIVIYYLPKNSKNSDIQISATGSYVQQNPSEYYLDVVLKKEQIYDLILDTTFHDQWKISLLPFSHDTCTNKEEVFFDKTSVSLYDYKIQKADTLEKITKSFSWVTVEDIIQKNNNVRNEDLRIWETLFIPLKSVERKMIYECQKKNSYNFYSIFWQWGSRNFAEKSHMETQWYRNLWKISVPDIMNNFSENLYQDNWDGTISLRIKIFFQPQKYFYWAILFTVLGLILLFITFIVLILGKRNT